jgi:lipoprotein-anchoring transpeptidase ErfK/SrfK
LTLSASGTATTGTVTVTITGISGSLTNTTTLSLTVTLAPAVSNLPSPWADADIGATGAAGSGNYANGTFTVNGAGLQIYGSSDAFNFVYQPLTGDGSIVARLVSLQAASNPFAVAGVMIRSTLAAGSPNAKTAYWPVSRGIEFDLRTSSGGTTNEPSGVSAALPYWIKVTRSGSTFTGYVSSDGVNWVPLGSSWTITMGQTVYVGLAASSGSTSALATATFDNVAVTVP